MLISLSFLEDGLKLNCQPEAGKLSVSTLEPRFFRINWNEIGSTARHSPAFQNGLGLLAERRVSDMLQRALTNQLSHTNQVLMPSYVRERTESSSSSTSGP